MKCFSLVALVFAVGVPAAAASNAKANPLGMVLSLMDDLLAKLTRLGEEEDKAYQEYFEWCDDTSKNGYNTLTTLKSKKEKLEATIAKLTADININDDKIAKLIADIERDTKDLDDATLIRNKEQAEFEVAEGELVEGIDTLSRAIGIIGRDMAKNPAALAQIDTSNLSGALKALSTVLDAAAFSAADKTRLTALIQSRENSDDPGAPAAAVYKTHSGGIMEVLEDMKEEAEEQLSTLRKEDTASKNNFQMLKQSLEDSIAADNKDLADEKADKAANEEAKATAEGDLTATNKDIAETSKALATAQNDCMQTATDHEASTKGREEEMKVVNEAKKILKETTSGASSETYSLIQVARAGMKTGADLANAEVVDMVQQLAKKHHSAGLVQLASKISAVLRYGAGSGDDVFGKVKGLISDMIAKLEKEAKEDAAEKAYCDDQMAKTEQNKVELDEDIAKLTSKIDKASSDSAALKAEVKVLQAELAALAKEQANLDKVREEEHSVFLEAKADLELGLDGVGRALKTLREYYEGPQEAASVDAGELMRSFVQQPAMPEFHGKDKGAGGSVIGILEVVESDFAKELALEEKTESDSESEYQEVTQENKVTTTTKSQDVKYKTQNFIALDKAIADLTSDRATAQTSHDAVMEYYAKLKDRCIAKPESYEEIKARRTAEINGLKEALTILEGETAFEQGKKRGLRRHLFLHN